MPAHTAEHLEAKHDEPANNEASLSALRARKTTTRRPGPALPKTNGANQQYLASAYALLYRSAAPRTVRDFFRLRAFGFPRVGELALLFSVLAYVALFRL
jgi:hypothetical protein